MQDPRYWFESREIAIEIRGKDLGLSRWEIKRSRSLNYIPMADSTIHNWVDTWRGGRGRGICEQLKFEEIILYATFLIYKSEESGQVSAKRTEIFLPLPTNDLYLEPIRFVSLLIWFSTVPKLRDLSRRLAPSCVHNFNRISVGFAMLENSGTSNSGSLVSLQPSSIILDFSSRNFV